MNTPALKSALAVAAVHRATRKATEHSMAGMTQACSAPAVLRPLKMYARPCAAKVVGTTAASQSGSARFT